MKIKIFYSLLIFSLYTTYSDAQNIFKDKTNQQIWEAKDRNDIVFTKKILKTGTKEQQILALKGLQSWYDPELRKIFIKKLKKSKTETKKAVFEAIGQSRDSFYLPYLIKFINKKKYKKSRKEALAALGKCITKAQTNKLKNIKKCKTAGYSECIYRALLKGVTLPEFTDSMINMLQNNDYENRFYAAWYLSRTKNVISSEKAKIVIEYLENKHGSELEIPLLIAIAKCKADKSDSLKLREIFLKNLKSENLATRISTLRAILLSKYYFEPDQLNTSFEKNDIPQIQFTVSEIISANCKKFDKYKPLDYSPALLNIISNTNCTNLIKLTETGTMYDKIWYLKTIENDYTKYQEIQNILLQSVNPALKAAAAESMIKCANSKGFPTSLNDDFIETLMLLVKDRDAGVLSIIATAFIEKQINMQTNYNLKEFIELFTETLEELSLPREIEAFTDISKAISIIKDTVMIKPTVDWNNPIDWKHVENISKKQEIIVTTNKGKFKITLNVNEAPASVSAILKLVEEGFYNNKFFHRLVPNFVIQGGCPRGDGFGSLDYTLRSEFTSQKYSTGTVGLASAGPDTESCQWFVTHCSTPHLEGRYTIIGYISEGMETVNRLGVGDKIISIIKL